MRKSAVALVILLLIGVPRWAATTVTQQSAVDAAAIDEIVKQGLADRGIPGAAVAVVSNDRVVYEKGFGVANLETGGPVTPDMLFRISSNTKVPLS